MEQDKPLDLTATQRVKQSFGKLTGRLVTVTERNGTEHTGNLTTDAQCVNDKLFSKADRKLYGSQDRLVIRTAEDNGLESD